MKVQSKTDSYLRRNRSWHPKALSPSYKSSIYRSPQSKLLSFPATQSEETGPVFGHDLIGKLDNNLIHNSAKQGQSAIGPRIIVFGRLIDEYKRPIPNSLIEIWQANSGGRYRHMNETYLAALDPNFSGCGRTLTDENGNYEFSTIMPGPYPWPNGPNDWRPAHIHFSIFGDAFTQRLITQMYFEGDPLIQKCPIVSTLKSTRAVERLTGFLDMTKTVPMDSLAYKFDIVIRGNQQIFFKNKPEGS